MPPLPFSLRPGILVAAFSVAIVLLLLLLDWSLVELEKSTMELVGLCGKSNGLVVCTESGWKVCWNR